MTKTQALFNFCGTIDQALKDNSEVYNLSAFLFYHGMYILALRVRANGDLNLFKKDEDWSWAINSFKRDSNSPEELNTSSFLMESDCSNVITYCEGLMFYREELNHKFN